MSSEPGAAGPEIMSDELPLPETSAQDDAAKIFYYVDEDETPYLLRLPPTIRRDQVTLRDFKTHLQLHSRPTNSYKYFFKSLDTDIGGFVKEEIHDDKARLPLCENGRIVVWLLTADGSSHSDGSNNKKTTHLGKLAQPIREQQAAFHTAAAEFDQTMQTDESDSMLSALPPQARFAKPTMKNRLASGHGHMGMTAARHHQRRLRDNDSVLTSDSEMTNRFLETDDDDRSRVSTSTDITSVSRQYIRQRKKRKHYRQPVSRASSVTSVTESSMSLNIVTVTLNMDTVNFLGISIVGQSNQRGDGGIFVANIMKGGAVALDGRIEPGDMILQVNEVSFENLSNDDAVQVLREAVQKPGPIRLVVAKCWEPAPRGYFTIPRQEPVRPIDPGAWVAHTNAMRALQPIHEGSEGAPTPTPMAPSAQHMFRPPSAGTAHSGNSGSMTATSQPDNELAGFAVDQAAAAAAEVLSTTSEPFKIVAAMARPDSGLDVRSRTWLKITIPNAFLGSDAVDWLLSHVHGLTDRKDARKLAAKLLKDGLIRHTVNKITFSDQCYYVFNHAPDALQHGMENLRLNCGPAGGPMHPPGTQYVFGPGDEGGSEHDTVGPLPPPPSMTPTPWALTQAKPNMHTPSMVSGYASMPFQYSGPTPVPPPNAANNMPAPVERSEASHSQGSSTSTGNASGSDSRPSRKKPTAGGSSAQNTPTNGPSTTGGPPTSSKAGPLPMAPPPPPASAAAAAAAARGLEEVPRDLQGSRQSFRMAMGNPCEFFVDVM